MTTLIRELNEWKEPVVLAGELLKTFGEDGFIWLDGDGSQHGRWVTLAVEPIEEICSRDLPGNSHTSNPFDLLRSLSCGHWTGWLSYEAGAWVEPSITWKQDSMAILWMAKHDPVLKLDLHKRELWIEGFNRERLKLLSNWLKTIPNQSLPSQSSEHRSQGIPLNAWKWLTTKQQYAEKVDIVKKWIEKGDIFQANLSTCCTAEKPTELEALDFYKRLKEKCPSPFSGVIIGSGQAKGEAVISTSPERFLKVLPNGEVETRPIKGTRPRQNNPQKDADMAADLICSPKDRAENIMIVDLLRNDLGKVCEIGSINVSQLLLLESYSQVHHLTSVVKGNLRQKKSWIDLLEACWPGGSISGAPKIRACQRLDELESRARGPYCGSILHINWDGEFDSNILIRSLMIKGNQIRMNAGCGIVADSLPENEAEELTWKILPLLKALE